MPFGLQNEEGDDNNVKSDGTAHELSVECRQLTMITVQHTQWRALLLN